MQIWDAMEIFSVATHTEIAFYQYPMVFQEKSQMKVS